MRWKDAVTASLRAYSARHSTRIIRFDQFKDEELELIVSLTGANGPTPDKSLSKYLQDLRDDGVIKFVDYHGTYLLIDSSDELINVEESDLSTDELDSAILSNLLRIGIVKTATKLGLTRDAKDKSA